MLVEVENAHAATYYAAWAIDAVAEDAAMAASVTKAYVGDAARKVCGDAIQVHVGIGFSTTCTSTSSGPRRWRLCTATRTIIVS